MILTAVIPIHGPTYTDRRIHLKAILESTMSVNLVVVADSFREQDKLSIQEMISEIKNNSIQIVFGDFGNPGSARNSGLELISTDWFCFWDSDDEPYPDKFLSLVKAAISHNCKIAKGGYVIANSQKDVPEKKIHPKVGMQRTAEHIVDPGLWRYVFETEYFRDLRFPPIRMGEDQDFLVQALLVSDNVFTQKDVVYKYRIGSSTQLTNTDTSFNDVGESLAFLRKIMKYQELKKEKTEIVLTSYLKQFVSAIRSRKVRKMKTLAYSEMTFLLENFLKGKLFGPMKILVNGRLR